MPTTERTTARDGALDVHDAEAAAKRGLRRTHWAALRAAGAARFPGAAGRIPNFVGAEAAAARLAADPLWARARVVQCNPDLPQRPVRARALREGKRVQMAVPRLAAPAPFVRLDPERIPAREHWAASSMRWALEHGEPVDVDALEPPDLVVVGSVAVAPDGARLGKGGGYADLELALLSEAGKLGPRVPVVTTVHATQLADPGTIPVLPHDRRVDRIYLPDEELCVLRRRRRPAAILWDRLPPERLEAVPALLARARARSPDRGRRRKA